VGLKLNYLVVGDSPGSKLLKAQKMNSEHETIKIINEPEFMRIINVSRET
jgi:NAD-dependent DNA ligase